MSTDPANPGTLRAVLWIRSLAPHGINETQTAVIDRLRRIKTDDRIADLAVAVWGRSMGLSQTVGQDPGVREAVAEFERWATEHDRTLRPAFGRHDAGEGRVVLPLLCLAVYEAETVRAVYPHVDGEEVRTIQDGVEAPESMTTEGSSPERNRSTGAGTDGYYNRLSEPRSTDRLTEPGEPRRTRRTNGC